MPNQQSTFHVSLNVLCSAAAFVFAVSPLPALSSQVSEEAFRQAVRAEEQGNLDEARFYYAKSLLDEPRSKRTLLRVGLLQAKLGDMEAAQILLGRLEKICVRCEETKRLADALERPNARDGAVSQK